MKKDCITAVSALVVMSVMAGCTSQASRMADCQAQGVSRDACYAAEQNRQATISAAAEKQALENAKQVAQAAHKVKPFIKHFSDNGNNIEVKRDKLGIVTVDGKPAAEIERESDNISYQQGLYIVIAYATGKVAVTKKGVFLTYAK